MFNKFESHSLTHIWQNAENLFQKISACGRYNFFVNLSVFGIAFKETFVLSNYTIFVSLFAKLNTTDELKDNIRQKI